MQATFTSIVTEMVTAEKSRAPGPEKHAFMKALEATRWIDDSNRAELELYIDLAKRPEVLAGLQAAQRKCCR